MSRIWKSPNLSPSIPIREEASPAPSLVLDSPQGSLSPKKRLQVTFGEKKKVIKKSKLRGVLWMAVYPYFLNQKFSEKILGRKKKVDIATSKQIQEYKGSILEFIQKHCLATLMKLYKEKKCLMLINEEREDTTEISRRETEKRVIIILVRKLFLEL